MNCESPNICINMLPKPINICRTMSCVPPEAELSQTNKIINGTVRMPASLYLAKIAASQQTDSVNWNQMSDRKIRHEQPNTVPTRGNTTRTTTTALRPGAMNPGGSGVDVKHNSYNRYMNRIKGKNNNCCK